MRLDYDLQSAIASLMKRRRIIYPFLTDQNLKPRSIDIIDELKAELNLFQSLPRAEQEWLLPLIQHGGLVINAIDMMRSLEGRRLTFEELALERKEHLNTIKHRLNALHKGGAFISLREGATVYETGRPRKLASR